MGTHRLSGGSIRLHRTSPQLSFRSISVAVAQLVERWIVDPAVAGSKPVGHPHGKTPANEHPRRHALECSVSYRSNQSALDAARVEEQELAALMREARMRRTRAGAMMAALLATVVGGIPIAMRSRAFAPLPALHCHHIVLQYEQMVGTPPRPLSWEVCERK